MASIELLNIIKAKPENKALLLELSEFIINQSKSRVVDEKWINDCWDFFELFSIPELVPESGRPLWGRLQINSNINLKKLYLIKFKSFLDKNNDRQGLKVYQLFLEYI